MICQSITEETRFEVIMMMGDDVKRSPFLIVCTSKQLPQQNRNKFSVCRHRQKSKTNKTQLIANTLPASIVRFVFHHPRSSIALHAMAPLNSTPVSPKPYNGNGPTHNTVELHTRFVGFCSVSGLATAANVHTFEKPTTKT